MAVARIIAILGFLFAGLQSANAAVLDFEDITAGDLVNSTYAGLGVTFVDARVSVNPLAGATGDNIIQHGDLSSVFGQLNPITAVFGTAVNFVSVDALDVGLDGAILKAFNQFDAVIGTDSFSGVGPGVGNFGTLSLSIAGISRVEFSQINDFTNAGDGLAFDRFEFTPVSAVPIPAALPLLLTGLVGLGIVARRRKTA